LGSLFLKRLFIPKDALNCLKHILDETKYINSVIDTIEDKEAFLENKTLKRAIVRSLEIIGEATKKIPQDIKVKWNFIEWKNMAGMRDKLIHDYMRINYYYSLGRHEK